MDARFLWLRLKNVAFRTNAELESGTMRAYREWTADCGVNVSRLGGLSFCFKTSLTDQLQFFHILFFLNPAEKPTASPGLAAISCFVSGMDSVLCAGRPAPTIQQCRRASFTAVMQSSVSY
mmetsp:Transcript_69007/g.158381  ORF Transcript_69007/g.158381 Transcript_69007/m.158381 type:complete len:121 (-) Transcript_69007:124-486(-)